jgi:hypothetical protein
MKFSDGLQFRMLQDDLIDVTPTPVLAGFDGLHDRVPGGMEMFGSVFVFGGIAATDVSARQTEPKMHPGVAHFQALLAALGVRKDGLDFLAV